MALLGAAIGAGIPILVGAFCIASGSSGMKREDRYLGTGAFNAKSWGSAYEQQLAGIVLCTAIAVGGGFLGHQIQELHKSARSIGDSFGTHQQDDNSCSLYKPEECNFFGN